MKSFYKTIKKELIQDDFATPKQLKQKHLFIQSNLPFQALKADLIQLHIPSEVLLQMVR